MATPAHPSRGAAAPNAEAARVLRERLGEGSAALPFARAVLAQLTGTPGAAAAASPRERRQLAEGVAELLRGAERGDSPDAPARALLAEPALASALFQNVDLLYAAGWAAADAVSAVVMRAVELAASASERGDA